MRHAVYSALNKPRLLMGVDYRIFLVAGASGLPILAFTHSRAALVAAFLLPFVVFTIGAAAFRKDPQFLAVLGLNNKLRSRCYDGSKRGNRR
jgi:type IV secretory pathway TrbD component